MIQILTSIPILVVGAVLALLLRANRASAAVTLVSQGVATVLVLTGILPILQGHTSMKASLAWPAPIERIVFRIDALGAFFMAWSLPLTLLGTIYAVGYLKPYFVKGRHGGPHFALLNMTQVAFVLIYSVQNALVFLLAWEVAAVAAWLLVIWDYPNQKIRFAGFNYLVSTHVGMFVLVAAFMLLHSETDSLDFRTFGIFLSQESPVRGALFLLLGVSFALKSAFYPFHTWLPRAHSAAPAHVSALMSGVIHKAGLFGFLRFSLLMGKPDEWMGWSVLGFGALSAFFGVINTTTQRDLKRMLGYSSTENVGIAAMGFGIGYLGWTWDVPALVFCGFAGGLLHLLNHAFFKCLLFYAAGAIYRATHSVDIERLGGLAKRLPRTAMLFLLGGAAISALPPFNGFISEFILFSGFYSGLASTAHGDLAFVSAATVLAFAGVVSSFSIIRAFGLSFLGQPRDKSIHRGEDPPPSMLWTMVLHGFGILILGLIPGVGGWFIRETLRLFPIVGLESTRLPIPPEIIWGSRILALAMVAFTALAWSRARKARTSPTWGCGYTAASARMQYTGSSFSGRLAELWNSFLPVLRRDRIRRELFPQQPGNLATHHVDAVERRIFEALGHGEGIIARITNHISEQPHIGFAAGLAALILIVAILFGGFSK